MTPASRVIAMIVGIAGIVLALAGAVREIVVAADVTVHWQSAATLRRLTSHPSAATWVTAGVTAAAGVALLVLVVRQFRAPEGGPQLIQFKDDAGWARLDVRAVQRGMRRRLSTSLPGVTVRDLQLRKEGEVWRIIVTADVPARDLQRQRARMQAMLGEDLLRMGGMRLRRLDLVVAQLVAP